MSSLEEIKSVAASFSEDDRARLREWFSEKDSRGRGEGTGRNPVSDGPDFRAKGEGGGEKTETEV